MPAEQLTEADTERAKAIWDEYQRANDLSAFHDQAAGVDPRTGEVFVGGRSGSDIAERLKAEGRWRPLVMFRVGRTYYSRVRGRQRWSKAN